MGTFDFYQDGCSLDYTPGSAVTANKAVVVGSLVGIALRAIAANEAGTLCIKGVFKGAKVADAHAFAQGEVVYLDESAQVFTHDADGGANIQAGHAAYAATAASTTLYVALNA